MLNFYVISLFPEIIINYLNHSIIKRALDKKIINITCVNIRDFSCNKNKRIDDYSYGGGAGMIIQAPPVYCAYKYIAKIINKSCPVIYLNPQGEVFNQDLAYNFSRELNLILLCGRYEGIDQRVIDKIITREISIGDYILTGGELAAVILIDAISRLVPGVLGKNKSYEQETFENNLLEYSQYTRPKNFENLKVPEVLLSGDHKKILQWRTKNSVIKTLSKRPDLILKNKRCNNMNIILERKSIRKYKNMSISQEQLELLLRAGMAAPSAMNSQNWEFIIIQDREHLITLSKLNQYHEMLAHAALAIVVCGDLNKTLGRQYWIQNCSAAMQNILLQAQQINLGGVWLGVCPFEDKMQKISENLSLPDHIKPLGIISLGVPDEFRPPNDNFDPKKIHYEKFDS